MKKITFPVEEPGIIIRTTSESYGYFEMKYIDVCPTCKGNSVARNGRCKTCLSCGWSSCEI